MSTNLVRSAKAEEFLTGYNPVYKPIYPLFLDNAQEYAMEAAERKFKRAEALGDIRNRRILPKDSEIKQWAIGETQKSFKAYLHASQFVRSTIQNAEGIQDGFAQALEEHQKAADELFCFGDGTSSATAVNNGLIYSTDSNFTLKSGANLGTTSTLQNFHSKIMELLDLSPEGDKMVLVYGSAALGWLNNIHGGGSGQTVLQALNASSNAQIIKAPSEIGGVVDSSSQGVIVVSKQHIKTHYCALPQMLSQGIDEKNLEAWANFIQGNFMVEVLTKNGIIHQPLTAA